MFHKNIEVLLHIPDELEHYREELSLFIEEISSFSSIEMRFVTEYSVETKIVISLVSKTLSDFDEDFYASYSQKSLRFLFFYFQDSEIGIDDFDDEVFERVEFKEEVQKESNLSHTFSSIEEIKSTLEKNLKESISDLLNRTNYSKINAHIINRSKGDKFYNNDNNLRKVDNFLRRGKRVALINGLGGVGKTTLAIEYATNALDEGIYDYALWFDVENGISSEVKKFAISYLLDENEDGKQKDSFYQSKLNQFLREYPNVLIILDNLEYQEPYKKELETFLRDFANIDVIITSRQVINKHDIHPLELYVFKNEHDGLEMFKLTSSRQYSTSESSILKEIINHLGKLPLALEITANFLSEFTDMPVQDYLDALKNEGLKLFSKIEDYNHLKSLRATLTINDKISKDKNALKLLKIFSIISPEVIEKEIIETHLMEILEISTFDKTLVLKDLERFSYIKLSKDGYTMHRLLQEAIRDELFESEEEQINSIRDVSLAMFRWFTDSFYDNKYGSYFVNTVLQIEYILDIWNKLNIDEARIYLYTYLSAYYGNIGRSENEVLEIIEKAILLLDKVKIENTNIHIVYGTYIQILGENKENDKAIEYLNKSLLIIEDESKYSIYHYLGDMFKNKKKYIEAKKYYEYALGESRASRTLNALANIYIIENDYKEAEILYKESLEKDINELGEIHPNITATYYNLGYLFQKKNDVIQSFDYYTQSVIILLALEVNNEISYRIKQSFQKLSIICLKLPKNKKTSLNKKIEELNTLFKEKGFKKLRLKKIK